MSVVVTRADGQSIREKAKTVNLSIGRYIRMCLLSPSVHQNHEKLQLEIAQAIDLVEAYIYEKKIDLNAILKQLELIQTLST